VTDTQLTQVTGLKSNQEPGLQRSTQLDADGINTHFYVDGVLVASFSTYYPTALMAIDFNQWFPLAASSTRRHPVLGWNRSTGCITPKIRYLRRPKSKPMSQIIGVRESCGSTPSSDAPHHFWERVYLPKGSELKGTELQVALQGVSHSTDRTTGHTSPWSLIRVNE
jgi:hypothetical protein